MVETNSHEVTRLLVEWSEGSELALDELMPLVYQELRAMASSYMKRQGAGHTIQTTELIHEAYLKLAGPESPDWKNRAHFFGVAAKAMRHILVDYARAKSRSKRGGGNIPITFNEDLYVTGERAEEILALDTALEELEALDSRKSKVVELKFFGGMTFEEISATIGVSVNTSKRDWRFARSWLLNKLSHA